MKHRPSNPVPPKARQRQAEGNRRIAAGLVLLALFVFATSILRQWLTSG